MKTYLDLKSVQQFCRETGWGYTEQGEAKPFSEEQFKKVAELLGNVEGNPAYRALFDKLALWIVRNLNPRRSLEIGCGPGYLVHRMARMGIDAVGIDGNRHFWSEFQLRHHDMRQRYVLDPLFTSRVQKSDVFISIEVFEHIPDDALHNIMMRVRHEAQPSFIVFSSTPFASELPGWDLQWGHINLKQPDEWSAFFSRYGYQLHASKPPVTQWAQLYLKQR